MSKLYDILKQLEQNEAVSQETLKMLPLPHVQGRKNKNRKTLILLLGSFTILGIIVALVAPRYSSIHIGKLSETRQEDILKDSISPSKEGVEEGKEQKIVKDTIPSREPQKDSEKVNLTFTDTASEERRPEVPTTLDNPLNNEKPKAVEPSVSSGYDVRNGNSEKEEVISMRGKREPEKARKSASAKQKSRPKKAETQKDGSSNPSQEHPHSPDVIKPPQEEGGDRLLITAEEARREGNTSKAIKLYEQYLAATKENIPPKILVSTLNNLGALLISTHRFDEAEKVLGKAINVEADEDVIINLISVKIIKGKTTEACEMLKSYSSMIIGDNKRRFEHLKKACF